MAVKSKTTPKDIAKVAATLPSTPSLRSAWLFLNSIGSGRCILRIGQRVYLIDLNDIRINPHDDYVVLLSDGSISVTKIRSDPDDFRNSARAAWIDCNIPTAHGIVTTGQGVTIMGKVCEDALITELSATTP